MSECRDCASERLQLQRVAVTTIPTLVTPQVPIDQGLAVVTCLNCGRVSWFHLDVLKRQLLDERVEAGERVAALEILAQSGDADVVLRMIQAAAPMVRYAAVRCAGIEGLLTKEQITTSLHAIASDPTLMWPSNLPELLGNLPANEALNLVKRGIERPNPPQPDAVLAVLQADPTAPEIQAILRWLVATGSDQEAGRALELSQQSPVFPQALVEQALDHPRAYVRRAAVRRLSHPDVGVEFVVAALTRLLKADVPLARTLVPLLDLADDALVTPLFTHALGVADPPLQKAVFRALTKQGRLPQASDALVRSMLAYVGDHPTTDNVRRLTTVIADASPALRESVLVTVIRKSNPLTVTRFLEHDQRWADCPGDDIRRAILGRLPKLAQTLRPDTIQALLALCGFLQQKPGRRVVGSLLNLVMTVREGDARDAIWGAIEFNAMDAPIPSEPDLIRALNASDTTLRRRTAQVLAKMGTHRSIERLQSITSGYFTPPELQDAVNAAIAAIEERGSGQIRGAVSIAVGDGRLSRTTSSQGDLSLHEE